MLDLVGKSSSNDAVSTYLKKNRLEAVKRSRMRALRLAELRLQLLLELLPSPEFNSEEARAIAAHSVRHSSSQKCQDIFALASTNFKRGGYFVEFGALDGIQHSNSYMLETVMDWRGILAEPARVWHEVLRKNRPNASIDTDCVYSETGLNFDFHETPSGFSALAEYKSTDELLAKGVSVNTYQVRSISLNDLLEKYGAPSEIDYLSIDTEGSEYEILARFDFGKYKIKVITVEHAKNEDYRKRLFDLLTAKGYARRYEQYSYEDDWYVLA